tara:strand:- start:2389 stop:2886 length:498 start_codon:yes stop_codon:yes gene_type:complete
MRLIQDGMLDKDVGNKLIEIYKNNPSKCALWANTNTLNLAKVEDLDDQLPKKIVFALNNYLNSKGVISYPELVQVVHRPTGTKHDMHVDEARDTTIMTSITYLNDNYEGGETFFEDGMIVKPKIGRTIFFDGIKYPHGVKEITKGNRFVIASWYTDNLHELYGIN